MKCAYYQGLLEEFDESAELYAAVGLRCLDNNLLKFNARDYFLRAGLLYLAAGEEHHSKLKTKLMDFKTGDASFAFSRECLFLENMLAMFGGSDIHSFADHVYNFDNVAHLDSWCLEMLYELRSQIQEQHEKKEKAVRDEKERRQKEHDKEVMEKEMEKKAKKEAEKRAREKSQKKRR